jgi:hypothetical protein
MAMFVASAAVLAACFPVALSVAAVWVFAGPHNWMEARYFASRMPVQWGQQRTFFLTALAGVACLSVTFSAVAVNRSLWHSAAALWILALVRMARKEVYSVALPLTFLWMSVAWAAPGWADLSLVFLHPLAALWFVHRQIFRTRPEWLGGFRAVAAAIVPLALIVVFVQGARAATDAEWPGMVNLSFANVSASPALVALHAFLELLHYGAWVVILPCIGLASAPWDLRSIPLVRHREGWPRLVISVLAAGLVAVVLLWIFFLLDYRTTRDVYFTVAVVHVLAEVPFLAWLR